MALTTEEKEQVIEFLDKMDRQQVERILSSLESFADWLNKAFKWIFKKLAEWELYHLFEQIMDIF